MVTWPNLSRIVVAVVSAVLIAAAPAASDPPVAVNITGIVRLVTTDGPTPYPGDATVTIQASGHAEAAPKVLAITSIDANGRFAIYGLALDAGIYQLAATLEKGGEQRSVEVRVAAGNAIQTIDTTIDVAPRPVLRGPPKKKTDRFDVVPIFFATDRAAGPADPGVGASFLNTPWSPRPLAYGHAEVTIPRSHHERGHVEGGDERYVMVADKVNHIVLKRVDLIRDDDFFHQIGVDLNTSKRMNPHRRVIVYIHGYNNSFDHAVRVAAQIKYDLRPIASTMILYSWSSRNTIQGYFDDQASSSASAAQLKSFLGDIVAKSGGAEVSIIAHSMGNSALTLALEAMSKDGLPSKPIFENLIMAAPDIPAAELATNSCTVARLARTITLYASDHDQALLAALAIAKVQDTLHLRNEDIARAGLAHPLLLALGIQTVDASTAVTDFLGHGYFSQNVDILTDIQGLLAGEPLPRSHLITRTAQSHNYWLFSPHASVSQRANLARCPTS